MGRKERGEKGKRDRDREKGKEREIVKNREANLQNLSVEEIELDVIFDARTFCTCLYNKALMDDCQ